MTKDEVEAAAAAEKQAQADFDAGGVKETSTGKAAVVEAPAKPEVIPAPVVEPAPAPKPKYARITEEELAELRTKAASHESQFAKAFGTIGNLQKTLNELRAAKPQEPKVEVSDEAFAEMAKDFPELTTHIRKAIEATLKGAGSTQSAVDPEQMKKLVAQHVVEHETEALEDAYPDWRTIVGAVDATKEQPDPGNAFRKWLSTKDDAYQARINSTLSAAVLSRAISQFKADTKESPKPAPDLKAMARAARVADAVQPRGDGGHPTSHNTAEDEFAAGFASR